MVLVVNQKNPLGGATYITTGGVTQPQRVLMLSRTLGQSLIVQL